MTRRPWLGVGVSVVVHVALFALVVVSFARDESRAPIVVDLDRPIVVAEQERPGQEIA